ncbi:MAG: response regulator [Bryobacteraceae bacterium]
MPTPGPISDFSSQPRVLLVEDNATNLLLARRVLEKAGYWVEVAVNGREGVEAAKHQRFDVILMDVQMPVLDGCAASREIRRFPGWAGRVPIIALTASVYSEDSRRCFEAGMDDFVGKPFRAGELAKKCQQWMSRRPAEFADQRDEAPPPEATADSDQLAEAVARAVIEPAL